MGEPLLVLRLEGALQAWGERARWDIRDSLREPTKSGVVGLLGCALGVSRNDASRLADLSRALRMGVRVEREGSALDDYHTVSGDLPTAEAKRRDTTIVSRRRYLEDAAFLVMLAHDGSPNVPSLDALAKALQAPSWPLYLGRRSCIPTRPVLVELCDRHASLSSALAEYPWSCLGADASNRVPDDQETTDRTLRVVIDDPSGPLERQDAIDVNDIRIYERRRVREYRVALPAPQEVDA